MKFIKFFSLFVLLSIPLYSATTNADETLVFIRHAEKPSLGLGQLSCQGLNRSLHIPQVLISKFGKPNYIYAPNPSDLKNDKGTDYYYIRPLATIEPTAIFLAMPVSVKYGFKDHQGLVGELLKPNYSNATVFVAWEHHLAAKMVEELLTIINGQSQEVTWEDGDFDSILVVKIKNKKALLVHDSEGLNQESDSCPSTK